MNEYKYYWIAVVITATIAIFCMCKFGYRYAGIKELRNLEKRVNKLENDPDNDDAFSFRETSAVFFTSGEELAELRQGERQPTEDWLFVDDYMKNNCVTSTWKNKHTGEVREIIGLHAPSKRLNLNEVNP